ncbi:unnamed protein product [Adineta ricciae]|uniref:Uncharacterized protein n=1 Tax=Adineta ricciae TaxID=249248 RepID=A0A816H2C2_ADIRI|nr:unnamed protein product [Adineta ricciae]
MWYPPQQQQHHPHQNQQQRWLRYNQHLSSQQHQQSCSTTSYYCTSNEPSTTNRTTNTYVGLRNDENEAFNQYHSNRADDVYVKVIQLNESFSMQVDRLDQSDDCYLEIFMRAITAPLYCVLLEQPSNDKI